MSFVDRRLIFQRSYNTYNLGLVVGKLSFADYLSLTRHARDRTYPKTLTMLYT